jgi:YHS domain-containing protein
LFTFLVDITGGFFFFSASSFAFYSANLFYFTSSSSSSKLSSSSAGATYFMSSSERSDDFTIQPDTIVPKPGSMMFKKQRKTAVQTPLTGASPLIQHQGSSISFYISLILAYFGLFPRTAPSSPASASCSATISSTDGAFSTT